MSVYQPDVVQSPNQQLTMVHYMDEIIVCIMGSAQRVEETGASVSIYFCSLQALSVLWPY